MKSHLGFCLVLLAVSIGSAFAELNADALIAAGINPKAVQITLDYYQENYAVFTNHNYVSIIDFTKPSSRKRLYVINTTTGQIDKYFVSHAENSGSGKWMLRSSNEIQVPSQQIGTELSPVGPFKLIDESWVGSTGHHVPVQGLENTPEYGNATAFARYIYLHGYYGVDPRSHLANDGYGTTSEGCFMIEPMWLEGVIAQVKGGTLLYVYWDKAEVEKNMASGDDGMLPSELNDGYVDHGNGNLNILGHATEPL